MFTPDTRRDHILGAAEQAFARFGFHGASMQQVAAEAGMSVGNLYRSFPSKDAIVSGLTERDRAAIAREFQQLAAVRDVLPELGALLRRHLVDEPAQRSQLMLEIWAEAARNPAIASMCGAIDRDVDDHLTRLVVNAQALCPALRGGDPGLVVRVMSTVVDGLFKRRATEPDFDGDAEIALALGIFKAAFDGTLRPYEDHRT